MIQHLIFALIGGILGGLISPVFGIMGALFGFFAGEGINRQTLSDDDASNFASEGLGTTFLDDSFEDSGASMSEDDFDDDISAGAAINPENGLPMVGGVGGVDVAGNPYGVDNSGIDFDHMSDMHSINDDLLSTDIGMDDFGMNDSFMDSDIGGTSLDDSFS